MRSRISRVAAISAAGFALAITGTAVAGAGGSGCNYGGQLAELESQQFVQADPDSAKIDPQWLELLEQQEGGNSDASSPLVVHN